MFSLPLKFEVLTAVNVVWSKFLSACFSYEIGHLQSSFLLRAVCVTLQKQARRVYEILRLQMTDIHNSEQYRRYRLDVKNRLNVPYQVREHGQYFELPDSFGLSCGHSLCCNGKTKLWVDIEARFAA